MYVDCGVSALWRTHERVVDMMFNSVTNIQHQNAKVKFFNKFFLTFLPNARTGVFGVALSLGRLRNLGKLESLGRAQTSADIREFREIREIREGADRLFPKFLNFLNFLKGRAKKAHLPLAFPGNCIIFV